MIAWILFALLDVLLIYLTFYKEPYLALWSGMAVFAITSVLFLTAKEYFNNKNK